jgi:hypothetical protein
MASETGGSGGRVENSHANDAGEDRQPLQLPPVAADILCRIGQMFFLNSGGSALSDLEQILERSQALEPFKHAVRSYCTSGAADLIHIDGYAPAVKVRRLLAHILSSEPHLPIERVWLRGRSGCSDFSGTVQVHTPAGTSSYEFIWDCRWRAEQEGWLDCFGFPDQIRAAREYDWRCFQHWAPIEQ